MAKQKTKLKSFFEGKRRECVLQNYHPLESRAGEKRFKLFVAMPLSNKPVDGMPEAFVEQYELMEREKSVLNHSKVGSIVEDATFQIFATDTVTKPAIKSVGVILQNLKLIGVGIGESREVSLEFEAYVAGSIALKDWLYEHIHKTFFTEVEPSQMELPVEDEKPAKKGKKGKAPFDPEGIQQSAKSGELIQ